MERLNQVAHSLGRCGGYEVLGDVSPTNQAQIDAIFAGLRNRKYADMSFGFMGGDLPEARDERVAQAIAQVDPNSLKNWVTWFSSFYNRFNGGERANEFVLQLKTSLEEVARNSGLPASVELILSELMPQAGKIKNITILNAIW